KVARVEVAAGAIEDAAAGEDNGVDAGVERAGDAGDEGAHGVAENRDAFGVDVRALREVGDALHEVDLHEAGDALAPVGGGDAGGRSDALVMRGGAGLLVDVALAFADHVVGDDDGAGFGVFHAGVHGVPAELVRAVSVDHEDSGELALPVHGLGVGVVGDGGDNHAVEGVIGDAIGENSRCGREGGPGFGVECGELVGDVEDVADLFTPCVEACGVLFGGEVGAGLFR